MVCECTRGYGVVAKNEGITMFFFVGLDDFVVPDVAIFSMNKNFNFFTSPRKESDEIHFLGVNPTFFFVIYR